MENVTVTTAENWEKYVESGNSKHLKDNVRMPKSGQELIVSGEGWDYKVTVK